MAKRKKGKKNSLGIPILIVLIVAIIAALYFIFFSTYDIRIARKEEPSAVQVKEMESEETVLDAIRHAAKLLGVPDSQYRTNYREETIYVYIGINRDELDLNYANMIITGQVEISGGKIISGEELKTRAQHILQIADLENQRRLVVTIYYAPDGVYSEKKPQIAVIVDDFGYYDGKLLEDFLSLSAPITLSILPDLPYSRKVMEKAVANGNDALIHIPMEPINYPRNDPGSNAIFVHLSERQIVRRMQGYIRQLPDCVGANNHMGSLATADKDVMRYVLEVLKNNKLFFIDSYTTGSSVAYSTAQEMMVPSFKRDLFLDQPDTTDKTLHEKMREIDNLINNKGKDKIVIITHATNRERYNYLKKFVELAEQRGYEIVPISKLFETELPEFL
jgi:polysaccharide deacetylase 2 family uncharacterized protein YibQ